MAVYKPKVIEGKISGTGWPIDGHELMLSLWDYDNHESWHLDFWKDEGDQAVMETMFITETAAVLPERRQINLLAEGSRHQDK